MNNVIVLKLFVVVSFGISAIFTIMLMTSGTIGIIATILTALMGIVFEVAKCYFAYVCITDNTIKTSIRLVMGSIAVCLVITSIIASCGFVQNESNEYKKIALENSTEYKNRVKTKDTLQDLFNQKKIEISDLISQKNQVIQEGNNIKNSWGANYITMKQNIQNETDKKAMEIQQLIDKKSNELTDITNKINAPTTTNNNTEITGGYTAIFTIISDYINSTQFNKNKPFNPKQIEFIFYIVLSIIFELTAVIFAYIYQHELNKNTNKKLHGNVESNVLLAEENTYKNNRNKKYKLALNKNIIGFKTPNKKVNGINESDLHKYVDYMNRTVRVKDGLKISKGYQHIANNVGITMDEARKIKSYLEKINMIEVLGRRTILKN